MKFTNILAIAMILLTASVLTSTATASSSSLKMTTFQVQNDGPETLYFRTKRRSGSFTSLSSGKKTVITGKQIFLFEKEGGKYYFRGNSPFNKSCEGNTYMYYLQSFRSKGAKIKVGIFGRSCLNMDNAKHNAHEWKLEYERRRGTPDGEMIYHRTPEALKD